MALKIDAPRHVYVDLGSNWGDTLDIYEGLSALDHVRRRRAQWEVYAFEAAPLLMPYLEQLLQWKSGTREERPVTCLPPPFLGNVSHHWWAVVVAGHPR